MLFTSPNPVDNSTGGSSSQPADKSRRMLSGEGLKAVLETTSAPTNTDQKVEQKILQLPDIQTWELNSESMYQRGKVRRNNALQQLINAPFEPWDIRRGVYVWVSATYLQRAHRVDRWLAIGLVLAGLCVPLDGAPG